MRLVIPWIAGVFCGERFFDCSMDVLWGVSVSIFLLILAFLFHFCEHYSQRWCFGAVLTVLCFAGGWTGITWQLRQTQYTFPDDDVIYRALITDIPQPRERTSLCRVLVKEYYDSIGSHPVERKAILYLKQDSAAACLKSGDELLVSTRISPPANQKNFDEFDYARYLMRRGISGTGYVAAGKWITLRSVQTNGTIHLRLRCLADSYREKVIALYRQLGFTGDELAVLSALTIGDKTELSESVRESYSIAGASHILALSGLHIGLLYAFLFFILRPVARKGRTGRCVRSVSLLVLLWAFAFFTGLSPSVVRSVTMFSILALADIFGRQPFSLNTLAVTAWLMLLCNPAGLFDVGFQLSFLAAASILLIQRPVYRLFAVRNRVGKSVWGLMSVSIAAQIGTAPLVMFYFSRFSVHFLLTNLLVIPLITIILYAAIFMLLLTPFPWLQIWAVVGVRKLLEGLNLFVRWVEQLPCSSVDGIWLYQLEVCGIYVFLFGAVCYCLHRRLRNLLFCLLSVLLLSIYHVTMVWIDRPQRGLAFYNVRGCPAVHCIESSGDSWISYADTLPNKKALERVTANYWKRRHLLPPTEITSDCRTDVFSRQRQLVSFHGCNICIVNDNHWQTLRNKSTTPTLYIDYLYLCKGYDGRLKELTKFFLPGCIIFDASLSEYRRDCFKEECKEYGLRFISLSEEGSVRFLL
ncbi:ComEC/Rec2 family competence protein [Bacteroides finegoldii]|jgi:competence protein ComEC|uniref:ComEC/Rec2 family competence protein n=1 Tax=Bacteroides finegoldii TaxID=338188 RepID=UPI00234C4AB2|nr:ComEC/Rec2 family competence protein [Bacteroides finegoldii]MDC7140053.1 ComEC/Rec2 family competence protein [Bacteroides finegoldii]